MVESYILLAGAQRKGHVEIDKNPLTESSLPIFDTTLITIEKIVVVMHPPMKDGEEDSYVPLRWKRQNQVETKGRKKSKDPATMLNTYTTKSVQKKLLGNAMKANKSAITKRKIMKKASVVDEENVDVVDIGKGEGDVHIHIDATTARRRNESH